MQYPDAGDRRRRRSPHLLPALYHQLEYVQQRLSLEAVVLSDGIGDVVSWAGEPRLAQRLGWQCPWLWATPGWDRDGALSVLWDIYPGLNAEHVGLTELTLPGEKEPLILCAVGDSPYLDEWMEHMRRGIERIAKAARN